jgi:hypothetical protein
MKDHDLKSKNCLIPLRVANESLKSINNTQNDLKLVVS